MPSSYPTNTNQANFLRQLMDAERRQSYTTMSHQPQAQAPNALRNLLNDLDPTRPYPTRQQFNTYVSDPLRGPMSGREMVDKGLEIAGVAPVGMFIGKGAKVWDVVKNAQAQKMADAGVDARTIWSETGNWKAPDGMWRQEIPDNGAAMSRVKWSTPFSHAPEVESARMADVMTHNDLYGAYPEIGNAEVILNPNIKAVAEYHKADPSLDLGEYMQWRVDRQDALSRQIDFVKRMNDPNSPDYWKTQVRETLDGPFPIGTPRETIKEMRGYMNEKAAQVADMQAGKLNETPSTLLHELQHAIQDREGFARGGSPGGMAMEGQRALTELEGYNKAMSSLARQMDKAKARGDAQTLETLRTQYDQILNSKMALNSMVLDDPYQAYHHLAGEAEARATQARMNMDMPERLRTFPADSYDVPMDQLIVRYGDGPAMSTGRPRNALGQEIPPTQYELAHAEAQRVAALPIEQGGLGLPPGNTAMERARAMGMDVETLRGVKGEVSTANIDGTYSTNLPHAANMYAGENTGANVMQMLIKNNNPYMAKSYSDIGIFDNQKIANLESQGFDSAMYSQPDGANNYIEYVSSPKNIRSRFAAFDPAKRDSADLLAGVAPWAIPASVLGLMFSTDEADASPLFRQLMDSIDSPGEVQNRTTAVAGIRG